MYRRMRFLAGCALALMILVLLLACGSDAPAATPSATPTTASSGATLTPTCARFAPSATPTTVLQRGHAHPNGHSRAQRHAN